MNQSTLLRCVFGAAGLFALGSLAHAQITPGNLVVVRFGTGTAALANQSTATFLEEYTVAGGLPVQVLALPTAAAGANFPCTNSGTATSEGFLTQSVDTNHLLLCGYGAVPGSITTIVTTPSSLVPRIVARVSLTGVIDTTTALGDAFSGVNPRSVCSDNGSQFWLAGAGDGVRYAGALGATSSLVVNVGVTNVRVTDIFAGQLYVSANSGAYHGPATVGTGLPTTAGNPTTLLNGFPTTTFSYYDYFFADAQTVYVANDGTTGGIDKWTESGGIWTLVYNLSPAAGQGCRGLSGNVVAGVATLYATTTQTSANNLVSVTDAGVGSPFTVLATAAANTAFRGVRFVKGLTATPSTPFCTGDAVGTTCTGCGNNGGAGRGCGNSVFSPGALLSAVGVASTTADTLVLSCSQVTGPGLFFQSNGLIANSPFGDGMLCAAVGIIRMGVVFPVANTASYPGGTTPNPIHIAGGPINPGDIKHYQCWYRDAGETSPGVSFCTSATFNTSNGVTLTWQ